MWFEINVRLPEVTDLKWPHEAERQCVNSTLAMSWPNHVQIWSFASMASRQVAVKHRFVSKIARGCSSYDVIAPWPDLVNFLIIVAQGLPHKVHQNPATREKNSGVHQPLLSGRGLIRCLFIKMLYQNDFHQKRMDASFTWSRPDRVDRPARTAARRRWGSSRSGDRRHGYARPRSAPEPAAAPRGRSRSHRHCRHSAQPRAPGRADGDEK